MWNSLTSPLSTVVADPGTCYMIDILNPDSLLLVYSIDEPV